MKKALLLLGILSLAVFAGCTVFDEPTQTDTEIPAVTEDGTGSQTEESALNGTATGTETEELNTGTATENSEVREIEIESKENSFEPNMLTVKLNQPVKIKFKNTGIHTFTVEELGLNAPITGESTTVEFAPVKAGTFTFYCTGHRAEGMTGTLTVVE